MIKQAAQDLQDEELPQTVSHYKVETARQITWLKARIEKAAPQTLIVAS